MSSPTQHTQTQTSANNGSPTSIAARQPDQVKLRSPVSSTVKVVQLVNMLANGYEPDPVPHNQPEQVVQTTVTEQVVEDGNTTMMSIEENEVIGELLQSQEADQDQEEDMNANPEEEEEDDEEGEGEGSEEDEEDDEDEDDDEEDDEEDSGEESEDLGGSPEIVAIDGPNGPSRLSLPPVIKPEPGTPGAGSSTLPGDTTAQGEAGPSTSGEGAEGETNVLVPKKKKRAKLRSPSEEEDLPPPPPPMKTIRLERAMLPEGETLEWNILDDARENGMVAEIWGVAEGEGEPEDLPIPIPSENQNGMEIDGIPQPSVPPNGHEVLPGEAPAGPSSGPLFGLGFGEEDPEEIARRLEEKYGDDNKKSKKSKKRKPVETYDLEDEFIDDSEILIDAPTHFARPKKEGFFVHSGPLELMEESPVKPKARPAKPKPRHSNPAPPPKEPRASLSAVLRARKQRGYTFRGSQAVPISIDDDSDGERNGGPSRSRDTRAGSLSPPPPVKDETQDALLSEIQSVHIDRLRYKNASREERYLPPWSEFPDDLRKRLWILRSESEKQQWDAINKSRFPENLKPFLQAAGEAAYEHDIFGLGDREGVDKSFWHAITSALPYNEYTMKKLCTKLCYPGYWRWLHDCEDEAIRQFGEMVDKDREEVVSKYEESHRKWEEEVREWDEAHPSTQTNGAGPSSNPAAPMALNNLVDPPNGSNGPNGTPNPNSTPKPDDVRPPEPPKRFGWNSDMRDVFVQLVENMYNMVDLTTKAGDWSIPGAKTGKEFSEASIKQKLYKRIVDLFPEGYMNTGVLSREMSKINKVKKAKQNEGDNEN
ncbi:hypothetical protein V866_002525 [Kwoniella sp. B9012]|uniref:Uncharacterized protein n=1 Tax=Kwoniella europaea PYCC6329 TaxID=1423913 RepID=A0AAX4KEI1_9TREE